jgi:hypothetical protein
VPSITIERMINRGMVLMYTVVLVAPTTERLLGIGEELEEAHRHCITETVECRSFAWLTYVVHRNIFTSPWLSWRSVQERLSTSLQNDKRRGARSPKPLQVL